MKDGKKSKKASERDVRLPCADARVTLPRRFSRCVSSQLEAREQLTTCSEPKVTGKDAPKAEPKAKATTLDAPKPEKPKVCELRVENGKIIRRYIGPEKLPDDFDEAIRVEYSARKQADLYDELIIQYPDASKTRLEAEEPGDFVRIVRRQYLVHPLLWTLEDLARDYQRHANKYLNEETNIIAHILSAIQKAIYLGEMAELKQGPFNWARKYLRGDGPPLHSEMSDYKPLQPKQIVGRFRKLSNVIATCLDWKRNHDVPVANMAAPIQECALMVFPIIPTLREHISFVVGDYGSDSQIHILRAREAELSRLIEKDNSQLEIETAARHIAEEYLSEECKRSKMSNPEIKALFHFLDNKPRENP